MLVNSLAEEEAFDGANDKEDGDGGKDEYDNKDEEDDKDGDYENVEMGLLPPMLLLDAAVVVLPLLQGAPRKGPQHQPLQ